MQLLALLGALLGAPALAVGAAVAYPAAQPSPAPLHMPPAQAERPTHVIVPDAIRWTSGPSSLPSGTQMAVLAGNPSEGGLFTMRLKVPNGWAAKPHFHMSDEHVTVISGTLWMGHGDELDPRHATAIPPGGFASTPSGVHHYAIAVGETVFDVTANGPWTVTYIHPADDPRNATARP
jgi:quercetin dioxygenase-like cupin family protein